MAKISILIAEHSEITREGLVAILNSTKLIEIAGTALSAKEACHLSGELKPDILLMDASLDDLPLSEVISRITKGKRKTLLIILSHRADLAHIASALKVGVAGYLQWTISKKDLIDAVLRAANGETVFCSVTERLISDRFAGQIQNGGQSEKTDSITAREREILKLVSEGYTSPEIARKLFISPRTVENHRASLLNKLKVKNTAGLIRYALSEKIG